MTPLEGENPFGANVNYDPDFDTLKAEIGKVGNVDYELVETTARKILTEKSKDIRVLSFLSLALLRKEDWESFADVFEALSRLSIESYDNLFPERPRARQNALRWLSEPRFVDTLAEKKPIETHYEHVSRLVESLTKLRPVLDEKFPEGAPFPSALYKEAQKWEKACKPKPKEEPAPAQAGGQAPAAQGAMTTPKDGQTAARKAALFLIEKEPQKPMGYRLLRATRWDLLEKAPPAQDGKTQLADPNEQQRAYFQKVVGEKDWQTALEKTEQAFTAGGNHLWLDLQRVAATAAKGLGDGWKAVHEAIVTETAMLVKRVPEITQLSFTNGTPFCDDATKDWLDQEVKTVFSSADGGGRQKESAGAENDGTAQERKQVNELVAAGKVEQALEMLQTAMSTSNNERENFIRSILISNLLLKGKQPDIAVSFLESLNTKIETYHLESWDPELTVEAWTALFTAYKAARANKPQNILATLNEKQNDILSRISRINPKKAFQLPK